MLSRGWSFVVCAIACSMVCFTGIPYAQVTREDVQRARALLSGRRPAVVGAIRAIKRERDPRWVPVLVEVLLYYRLRRDARTAQIITMHLQDMTGERLGNRYLRWIEWLGRHTELEPHPVYRIVKSAIYGAIDPQFRRWLQSGTPTRIRLVEVVWGGVPFDGIPALDRPRVLPARKARDLRDDALVFGVSIRGEARAYPVRMLDWHEMVNDVVGGEPVSLAYCTLCGSGILFSGRVGDRTLTFGSSGLLFRSNKLMYDRQTLSLWHQMTGEPVIGPLAMRGLRLQRLPLIMTTWAEWRRRFPHTTVLDPDTGYDRDYSRSPYAKYFRSPDLMFPVWIRDDRLPLKARVFVMFVNGTPVAFPVDRLRRHPVWMAQVDTQRVVVITHPETGAVQAYAAGEHAFVAGSSPDEVIDVVTGQRWRVTWDALVAYDGSGRLRRLPGHLAFWFGWYAFYPDTRLITDPIPVREPDTRHRPPDP